MADPHDDLALVEDLVSPSARRQLHDPPDARGGKKIKEEKESSPCGENVGCSEDGESGLEVTPPSSDCTMPACESLDCAIAEAKVGKENVAHGSAPPTPLAYSPASEDGATPLAPEIVPVACTEGAASVVTLDHELVEADRDEAWFKAIEARDCLSLMDILKAQKDDASRVSLCFKMGEQGRMAVHVAAMQGCFRLAKQLINLVWKKYPFIEDNNYKFYSFTSRDRIEHKADLSLEAGNYMYAKDGRSGLSAFEMANDIIGNTSISQYILYVGRDPMNRNNTIMYDAYEGTMWHMALATRNCYNLANLLEGNSRLLLETCGRLSVLDVAILEGNEMLVKQVMGYFQATMYGPQIRWKGSYFPSELRWEQIAERPLRAYCTRSIFELAEKVGRSKAFKELLQNYEGHVRESSKGAGLVPAKIQNMLRLLPVWGFHGNDVGFMYNDERVDLVYDQGRVDMVNDDFLRDILFAAQQFEVDWNDEWTAGFLADVDYNFEDRDSLLFSILRLNYAFKNPRQCMSLLEKFNSYMFSYKLLIYGRDGQGRTPLHTMVDHYNSKDFTFNEVKRFMRLFPASLDLRGRSLMIRALTKQFLEPKTMVSSHLFPLIQIDERHLVKTNFIAREKLRDQSQNNDIFKFQGLYSASFLYEDVNVLRLITSNEEGRNEIKAVLDKVHVNSSRHEVPQEKALFIASGSGNQTLLREWFKFKFDCMVEDGKGRTALHYAADANMLEFMSLPTSFFCSVDYPRKVEEEWMKRRQVERASLNDGQDSNGHPQSNASVGRKACILMLVQAGVDLSQVDKDGNIPDPGASSDTEFQSWWYNLVVKDSEDKKNSFNQAGNALSVVGALVAATSYIGPLQPPLSYSEHNGYVDTSRSLVKVFMWTNTLAFYLAVASVMFAVVPSLPMPQEGVLDELRRARHTVSSSLFLLLTSIVCILVSFAAATAVVVDNGDYYGANDFLLSPSVIGWFFCGIAMVSFFTRVMRLVFYRNRMIRQIYKFSVSALLKKLAGGMNQKILGFLVLCLLFVPALLERGLILIIFSMGRGLRRLWKERVRHQEPGSSTASQVSRRRPWGPIDKLCLRLLDWLLHED